MNEHKNKELYNLDEITEKELLYQIPWILETLEYILKILPKYTSDISEIKQ